MFIQVVLVDGSKTLQYAQQALLDPPAVGRSETYPGVRCVGLDVENCPSTNTAVLFQVCCACVGRWGGGGGGLAYILSLENCTACE